MSNYIISDALFDQIMQIRSDGRVNLFDAVAVQRLAFEYGFHELVLLLEDNRKAYSRFILTGERGERDVD